MTTKFLPNSPNHFLWQISRHLNPFKGLGLTLCLIVGQGSYVFLPGILGLLIDRVLLRQAWPLSTLLLFPTVWLISIVFLSAAKLCTTSLMQEARLISKKLIFKHLLYSPTRVYIDRPAGQIESLLQELSQSSRYQFAESFPFFVKVVITLFVAALMMSFASAELTLFFAVWALAYIPFSIWISRRSVRSVDASLASTAKVSAATVEVIENHELIPAFGTETKEAHRFEQLLKKEQRAYNAAHQRINISDLLQRIALLLLPVGAGLFLILTGRLATMTVGVVAGLFSLTLVLTAQLGDLGKGVLAFFEMRERTRAALKRLALPTSVKLTDDPSGRVVPQNYDFALQSVSFGYDPDSPVIRDLSLNIKKNEKIGLVGYTGAGKTTLVKLLRGHLVPTTGEVRIGDLAVDTICSQFLCRNFAEVSQTVPLFHRSIRENIAYGCDEITDDALWDIIERSQLRDLIKEQPDGLDTLVGVRGQKFSGGEKARLAIARAFAKDSKVVILDEATAAVDSKSEEKLQQGLAELMADRTVICISHRLSTLKQMDRILVLDNGRIVAQGSHDELLKQSPLYRQLQALQTA
jgi:ATP-binding cassette, subfamily B, bacterial